MATRIRASFRTCIQIPCRSIFLRFQVFQSYRQRLKTKEKRSCHKCDCREFKFPIFGACLLIPVLFVGIFPKAKSCFVWLVDNMMVFFVCSKRTQPSTSAFTRTFSIFGGFAQPNKCLNFLGLIIITPTACCAACLCPRMGADDTESLRSHTVCQFGCAFFVLH